MSDSADLPPGDARAGAEKPSPGESGAVEREGGAGEASGTSARPGDKGKPSGTGKRERYVSAWLEVAVLFITALVLAIFLQAFIIKPYVIPSPSMEPTLKEGDRVMVDRLTYHFRKPRRGEVIVFRFNPNDPANQTQGGNGLSRSLDLLAEVLNVTHPESLPFIKRVVGVEGDVVELKKGELYVNGQPYQADYSFISDGSDGRWVVPEGTVMVMGDNRPNSNDSRRWGFVPYRAIIGRAVAIWWPPGRWSRL